MKLTYIYHSCFVLETEQCIILFDYYKDTKGKSGYVHDYVLGHPKPLYILSSHFHPDHFSREIFQWKEQKKNIVYLLSHDILKRKKAAEGEAIFLRKGDVYVDDCVSVRAFGSTDVGVSFEVECENRKVFHAGDLNNWHWKDESTEREVKMAEGSYLHELKLLKEVCPHVDLAMFPVDPRIGTDFARGAEQFVDYIQVDAFVPMHFWNRPDEVKPFGEYARRKGVRYVLLAYPGEEALFL